MVNLDELEQLLAPRERSIDDIADDTSAILAAVPALIAAARERDRLRDLCHKAAGYMSARPMHPLSAEADLYERLRAAGGGT